MECSDIQEAESAFVAVFSDDKTSVLLIKRRDIPIWTLPGGGVEKGESPYGAAVREVKEECGLDVSKLDLSGLYFPINKLAKKTAVFSTIKYKGTIQTDEETMEARFFSITNLPKNLFFLYKTWIFEALKEEKTVRPLCEVTYFRLFVLLATHPVYMLRYFLSRAGFPINAKKQKNG